MTTFDEILDKYRAEALSRSGYGTRFEELMAGFLRTYPLYDGLLSDVFLWKDFPYRGQFGKGGDIGIDIVARTSEGEWWAVQCKMYERGHVVSKADIDSFMSASSKTFSDGIGADTGFSRRLLIATTDNLGGNTQATLENQSPPVSTLMYNTLVDARVDWDALERNVHGKKARMPICTLRPHQQRALDAALEHYRDDTRGKLIMACGSGKTITALRIAEAMLDADSVQKGCILFLAPSISLVGQSMRAWANNSRRPLMPICVCSDPKASRNDTEDISSTYIELPATTDPDAVVAGYEDTDRTVVVFSTYQSIACVSEAQGRGLPEFDLVVCDEAHRTTGVMKDEDGSAFTDVHDEGRIRAKRRMYMTATPRIYKAKEGRRSGSAADAGDYTVYSMDDEKVYGREFFRYSFGEAVRDGQLCDYKVLVLTIDKKDNPPGLQEILDKIDADSDEKRLEAVNDMCRAFGCLNAMAKRIEGDFTKDPVPMRSAVVFASWIQTSLNVTYEFNTICESAIAPLRAEAKHIDGRMNAIDREKHLNWLRDAAPPSPRILCNAKCLTEGVDVPALDAIMFFGSTDSEIDVIQSVGRVMRTAPGKEYGYIIIPIVVDSSLSPEEELDTNPYYKMVWKVLRALRSHDESLGPELDSIPFSRTGSKHVRVSRGYGGAPTGPDVGIRKDWDLGEYGAYIQLFTGKMVERVGDKDYIENWAVSMARIAPVLRAALQSACIPEGSEGSEAFRRYLANIRSVINQDVSEKDAIDMLMQQYVTRPIFNKLFGDNGAVAQNSVFNSVNTMMADIDLHGGLKGIEPEMDAFYESVERTLQYIDTAEGKQKTIKALYEKFFKKAFGKEQEKNGVVYTPGEIVDFILRSADDVLRAEFGRSLTTEGVNILDPFTGTGTFVAHLLGSELISKEDLERKYVGELFANEITLLAYYVATVNIENAYALASGVDTVPPFDNILLTDTFNIENLAREGSSDSQKGLAVFTEGGDVPFGKNRTRIKRENRTKITVIVGNPPYGANQKSANDDAKKRRYDKMLATGVVSVDQRIRESYLEDAYFPERPKNLNSVYDNYIRAFRWASDRIRGDDGVVIYVTPNGWLTGSAFVGFRKVLEKSFDSVYVYNLRGDQNSGDWKNEGEKVFGEGSKVGICITMLVHHKGHSGKGRIYYHQVENGMKRAAKLEGLTDDGSFTAMKPRMTLLQPAENGDWIVQRNSVFPTLMPLAGDTSKKFEKHCEETVFAGYSNGYKTNRDAWSYNFSKEAEESDMSGMLDEYARQTANGTVEYLGDRIKWNRSLEALSSKKTAIAFDEGRVVVSSYRPFSKRWFYNEPKTIDMTYQMPRIYPDGAENLTICVSGVGVKKPFSCLMTNTQTDLEIVGKSQCFPLYWYETAPDRTSAQKGLDDFGLGSASKGLVRHDGISDWALERARSRYGPEVTKEDIFYYIYGYLHSPDYREAFAEDLKLSLPRIGFVDSLDDFRVFSEAGRRLAELHLNYEAAPYPDGVLINGSSDLEKGMSTDTDLRVTKMKLVPEERKLVYNQGVVITGIPEEAFEYVVNGRSALAWLVDQYQVSTDKESGIVNDPNGYGGPAYILRLVLSVMTVSVETMKIVDDLPKLRFGGE